MGHLGLDVLNAGGGSVFAGFGVVVVEVWGAGGCDRGVVCMRGSAGCGGG